MGMNWQANDYFSVLMLRDKRAHGALEMLVDDLHTNKERTLGRFLAHSGSEDFLWGIVRLLGNSNSRVAGNAAYILGTVAESESGSMRVISLTASLHNEGKRILQDLTTMLTFDDAESVMNAAGTMGTLAESHEGRNWMLKEPCLRNTIQYITDLLSNDNMWTASNAALVLARLTIAEEGCEEILRHANSESILSHLVNSLGVDEAGRGMNAAFAIGRLCDMEEGRGRLLGLPDSERMISSLAKMLCCNDPGASKNACFALSCLATNNEGHRRLLKNSHSAEVLRTLSELLSAEDTETGWFAAMTLRTLASQPKGCLRLRDHPSVLPALKSIETREEVNMDLRDEVLQTLLILKKLQKPPPPSVQVDGSEVKIEWSPQTTKSGFQIKYKLYDASKCLYDGTDLQITLNNLQPATQYCYRVRAYQEGDESAFSDTTSLTTEETVPTPPQNVRVIGATTTQLKVGWEPPAEANGLLKGYYVFNGEKQVEHTVELSTIISALQPSTAYEISVCASTSKGKGPKEAITGVTTELGAHAPSKPEVAVRGRNEMHVSWKPPEVPLGRISRYDVSMNGDVVFSGTELHHIVRRLKPDTEYTFTVSAITSEGKCESKSTKKRTHKDEYEGDRAPLYQAPPKKEPEAEKKEDPAPKPAMKKRKSITSTEITTAGPGRGNSARSIKAKLSLALKEDQRHAKSAGPRFRFSYSHAGSSKMRNKEGKSQAGDVGDTTKSPPQATDTLAIIRNNKSLVKFFLVNQRHLKSQQNVRRSSAPVLSSSARFRRRPVSGYSSYDPSSDAAPSVTSDSTQRQKTHLPLSSVQAWEFDLKDCTLDEIKQIANTLPSKSHAIKKKQPSNGDHDKSRASSEHAKPLPKPRNIPSPSRKPLKVPDLTDNNSDHSTERKTPKKPVKPKSLRSSDGQSETSSRVRSGKTLQNIDINKRHKQLSQATSRSDITGAHTEVAGSVDGGKLLARRGSMKSSMSSGESDQIDEPDISWLSQVRRSEFALGSDNVTRTFSTMYGSGAYKAPASRSLRPGFMELEVELPGGGLNRGGPPSYVHRANTFIASHRPGMKRHLDRMGSPPLPLGSSAPNQWKPELPSTVTEKNHNKFVPMQFRTQPANLPRQATSNNLTDKGPQLEPLAVMSRSKTDMSSLRSSHPTHPHYHMDPTPTSSHHAQPSPTKHSSPSNQLKSMAGPSQTQPGSGGHAPRPSPRTTQSTCGDTGLVPGLVLNVPDSNTLQSAR